MSSSLSCSEQQLIYSLGVSEVGSRVITLTFTVSYIVVYFLPKCALYNDEWICVMTWSVICSGKTNCVFMKPSLSSAVL